jgi:hypothetical protein
VWRLVVSIGAVLWVGHCAHQNFLFFQTRAHAGTLLESLESYQTAHGHYPGDLQELPYFAQLDGSYRERILYTTYETRSNFYLSALQPFSKQVETYTSENGRWKSHPLRQMRSVLEEATSE